MMRLNDHFHRQICVIAHINYKYLIILKWLSLEMFVCIYESLRVARKALIIRRSPLSLLNQR